MSAHRRLPVVTEVTNSEMQAFRDCRHRHHLAYERGLRPKVAAKTLTFGSAAHAGLEAGYRLIGRVPIDELPQLAAERADAAVLASFRKWVAEVEEHGGDLDIGSFYEEAKEACDTARWVVGHYLRRFGSDLGRLVPLAVETPFGVYLSGANGRHLGHLRYAGVWDLVAYDPDNGDVVLMDHKTTSSDTSALDIRAELDSQMAGYLYALRETLRHNPEKLFAYARELRAHPIYEKALADLERARERLTIGRIAYNVIRRKRPSTPKINQDGTVSVAAIDTLPEIYGEALAEQANRGKPVTAKQSELLDRLVGRGDGAFVSRREFWRTGAEIEIWRSAAVAQASEMRAAKRDPKLAYRNPGNCTNAWSLPCSYRQICLDESPEILENYVVKARHEEVLGAHERAEAAEDEVRNG